MDQNSDKNYFYSELQDVVNQYMDSSGEDTVQEELYQPEKDSLIGQPINRVGVDDMVE